MCVSNLRDSPAVRVAKREARGWKTLFENNSVQLRFHTRVQAGPTPALFAPISLKTHLGGPADWLIRQLTVRRRRDQRPGNHAVVAALFVTSYFLAHSPVISWTRLLIVTGLSLRVSHLFDHGCWYALWSTLFDKWSRAVVSRRLENLQRGESLG